MLNNMGHKIIHNVGNSTGQLDSDFQQVSGRKKMHEGDTQN